MAHILLTGGAGYIGSHTALQLLQQGFTVTVVDNLCNSSEESLRRVEQLTEKKINFIKLDLCEKAELIKVFKSLPSVDAVIHFAALKAVGESVENPLRYYDNNINGSLCLVAAMKQAGMTNIVFSSSATVYGDAEIIPVTEDSPLQATNPYGQTKLMMEQILADCGNSLNWNVALLRYFNPAGAHSSGRIGEDPEFPNNLVPFVSQVAAGIRASVKVFGNDWPTPDGTGVRDYIHIEDLAEAHVAAVKKLIAEKTGVLTLNLGTGRGYSVLEVIAAFAQAAGKEISYEFAPRRAGDIASIYASPDKALREIGWSAKLTLKDMVESAWKWQSENPQGYRA